MSLRHPVSVNQAFESFPSDVIPVPYILKNMGLVFRD